MILIHWSDWEWSVRRGGQIQCCVQLVLDCLICYWSCTSYLYCNTVVKLMQHLVCVWKQSAHVVCFTAGYCSPLCFALTSLFLCGMLVVLLLLLILETQWCNICVKITMLQAFFKCFLVLKIYWSKRLWISLLSSKLCFIFMQLKLS